MANFKKLPHSKVSFSVIITKDDVVKAQRSVIAKAKKDVSIKGFRKGHAPEDMVIASIGPDRLAFEALNIALDKAYRKFITDEKLAVINAPHTKIPEKQDLPMEVTFEVEVFPEVKLGDYKKVKLKKSKIEVTEKEVEDVIKTICAQMELGSPVDRAVKEGDMIEVDFSGKDKDGKEIPNTGGENHKFRVGMGQFLPDLEKAFIGMKAGEEKKGVKVKFPKTYHASEMAGKTIPFDIKLHQVFEIDPTKLDEATIEKISGKKQSLEGLKEQIKGTITANKLQTENQKHMAEFNQKLAKVVKVDLPQSWIEKEVEARIGRIKASPQFQNDPETFWKQMGQTEEDLRKIAAKEGEVDLKVFLGLSEIVKQENIELNKDEMAQAHQIAHQHLGHEEGHDSHDHHVEMDKAILNMKIDKYLKAL